MSISSRITEIEQHIGNAYDKIEDLGIDITNVDKNIDNISSMLENVWNEYPKVTATDVEEATLNGTKKGRMNIDLKGNTEQTQLTGANLMKFNARSASSAGVDYVCNDKGEVTLTGPSTASTGFGYNQSGNEVVLNTGTYKFKVIGNFDNVTFRRTDTDSLITINNNSEGTINITEDNTSLRIVIYRTTGVTYNANFRITIASGNTATTEYYCGGTPSPSPNFPQTIHNVSGNNNIKIQNKNLFDGTYSEQGSFLFNNGDVGSQSNFNISNFIEVKPNTEYVLSASFESGTLGGAAALCEYDEENVFIKGLAYNNAKVLAFTTGIRTKKIKISYKTDASNYQLELGSAATTYVEHEEQNLPFDLKSKNLMSAQKIVNDSNSSSVYLTQDGFIRYVTSSNRMFIKPTIIKENTAYTFKLILKSGVTTENNIGFTAFYTDGSSVSLVSTNRTNTDEFEQLFNTDPTKTLDYIRSNYISSKEAFLKIEGSMILEGTYTVETIPNYEPYYDIKAMQGTTLQDDGIHQARKQVILDGNTSIKTNLQKPSYISFYIDIYRQLMDTSKNILCNMLTKSESKTPNTIRIDNSNDIILYFDTNFCDYSNSAIKNKLQELYDNGNPMMIEIPLAEEEIIPYSTTQQSQYNAIKQAKSYNDQTNISQTNDDLPFILDITALKK